MSMLSTRVLPGVAGWLQPAHGAAAGRGFHLLEAGGAVQLALVALLQAELADVPRCRGSWPAARRPTRPSPSSRLVDAADVADQVAAHLAQRVAAEQPRLDVHAREAEALRGEARHLLVGQLGADGQRFEVLALVLQALEAAAVAGLDFTTSARLSITASARPAPATA
jgi:hypothetical protein